MLKTLDKVSCEGFPPSAVFDSRQKVTVTPRLTSGCLHFGVVFTQPQRELMVRRRLTFENDKRSHAHRHVTKLFLELESNTLLHAKEKRQISA